MSELLSMNSGAVVRRAEDYRCSPRGTLLPRHTTRILIFAFVFISLILFKLAIRACQNVAIRLNRIKHVATHSELAHIVLRRRVKPNDFARPAIYYPTYQHREVT